MKLLFADRATNFGENLPDFDRPPVAEASIGIQFGELQSYSTLKAAAFFSRISDLYPNIEEAAPLNPAFETFGARDNLQTQVEIKMLPAPLQPRLLFSSRDGSEVVQLQKDRLFLNWRKVEGGSVYPRYPYLKDRFTALLAQLESWVKDDGLGIVVPTQCEALYVNQFSLVAEDGQQCGLSYFLPWLEGLQGRTEDGALTFRRKLTNEDELPVARLQFELRYGTDQSGSREAQLVLLVRGNPSSPTFDASLELIDAERKIIVQTFSDVTGESAHRLWGKTS